MTRRAIRAALAAPCMLLLGGWLAFGTAAPAAGAPEGAVEALDAWAPVDWDAPVEPVLITDATLLTVTDGTVEGDLLLRDGRIAAVGGDLEAPEGARVLDGTGLHVTPGIIDAHSHIAADAINEGSVNVSSMVGIEQVIDPEDVAIYREAAGGTTTSHVMHGSANPIGGKNVVIKHRWGEDADGLLFEGAPPTIKFALGENVKRSNFPTPEGMPQRYPGTRMGQIDVIRQALIDAREYRARWQEYRAGGEQGAPPRRDLTLEPLVEVLEGERLVHAHCYRADEMLQLLRVAEELGFRIGVLQHVLEGYKVADEIAAHGAGASTFSDWWAYKLEAYDAIPYNAALMTERGVNVSINSDSAEEGRHLNQEAAKTMKWGGMSEEQALAMVTINPARQLRVEDRVGSLEAGKDADVVLWEGHPLSSTAKALTTIIDGRIVFDVERDRARQEAIAAAKERLRERLGESETDDAGDDGEEEAR